MQCKTSILYILTHFYITVFSLNTNSNKKYLLINSEIKVFLENTLRLLFNY